MSLIANIVVGLIGVLHVYILVLQMFLWDKPRGMKAFGNTQAAATATKVLGGQPGAVQRLSGRRLVLGLEPGRSGNQRKSFFSAVRAGCRALRRGNGCPQDSVHPGDSSGGWAGAGVDVLIALPCAGLGCGLVSA